MFADVLYTVVLLMAATSLARDYRCNPLLIDLGRNGYQLTSAEDGVWFDLDLDRRAEKVSWTAAGGDDAFLWYDDDENGVVSHGCELYGAAFFAPANGFVRLKAWDSAGCEDVRVGGDENGVLDARDGFWRQLRLWIDSSHDGVSQPSEIFTLDEKGIVAIHLNYRWSGRRDEHGNHFRYTSTVTIRTEDGEAKANAADVFLAIKR